MRYFLIASLLCAVWTAQTVAQEKKPDAEAKAEAKDKDKPAEENKDAADSDNMLKVDATDNYIRDVPFVRNLQNMSGEACVEMYLRKVGHKITQKQVFNYSTVDPILGRPCNALELEAALMRMGFRSPESTEIINAGSRQSLEAAFQRMLNDYRNGRPSIVWIKSDRNTETGGNFVLFLGYNDEREQVIYHDPAHPAGRYVRMKKSEFLDLWAQKSGRTWKLVRLRLWLEKFNEPETEGTFSNADYMLHIRKLKKEIPEGFTYVIERPFIVIGDEEPAKVREHASNTIRWSAQVLKNMFFEKDPKRIIEIWLFENRDSFEQNAGLFRDRPDSQYGYYSSRDAALIINMAVGGGTVVHQMVHPFMESNFPQAPPWFREGLASLYEQSGERKGKVIGYTNWRLPALKRAIQKNRLPTIEKLMTMSKRDFYDDINGTNYAHARYVCYYLQHKGVLEDYYKKLKANIEKDPNGIKTLLSVLEVEDMTTFEKDWKAFTMRLRYYKN